MGTLTARFYSNWVQRYNVVFLTNYKLFVKIDQEMTSLLFWRTRSSQSAPPRKCCHGNSKGSTLKLLPFNKFLYIFRKSHQIWLNYLSPSLSYGQITSRVVPNTPPPGQDRVNSCFRHHYIVTDIDPLTLLNMNF